MRLIEIVQHESRAVAQRNAAFVLDRIDAMKE